MAGTTRKIFAVGDIHGCAWELQTLLAKLPLESDSTVVFLGDYIDRGSESRQVIDTILEFSKSHHVVTLLGNHEAMFLNFLMDRSSQGAGLFIYNGGGITLANYGMENPDDPLELPPAHRAFFRKLRVNYAMDDYFFVHAGLPELPIEQLGGGQHLKTMLWTRGKFLRSTYDWGRTIIHGHTPVDDVEILENRINVDTGCAYDNKLSAIELPAMRVYSVARQEHQAPVRFTTAHSRRDAARFRGALQVFVERGEDVIEFQSDDYSETGMNMHALRQPNEPVLQIDEIVHGYVGSPDHDELRFRGVVVRIQQQSEGICYGLRLESTAPPEEVAKVR